MLAAAAVLLSACLPTIVRGVSVTAVLIAITPARLPPPSMAAPATLQAQATSDARCLNEQNWQQTGPEALRQLDTFCVVIAPGRTVTVEQAAAIAAIQQLFADPSLRPYFQGVAAMPNAPGGQLPAIFFDDEELRYWVDLESGQVVEVD